MLYISNNYLYIHTCGNLSSIRNSNNYFKENLFDCEVDL